MIYWLINFWFRHIHPRIASLIATIGIFGLGICLFILFIVAQIADEVLEKESFAFDKSVLVCIHQFANPTLDRVMLAITGLGNPNIVVIVVSVTLGLLWWRRYYLQMTFFAIACVGAFILNTGLKLFFAKPRHLGVHWMTDIIAGYGVGFLWLMSCIVMLKLRQIEPN